nr:MAG: hypothetical protein 3 [Leviviridae sp.]
MLVEAILRQAEIDLDLSVERDVLAIARRVEHEGLSFLTITLPTLSDALERGLEYGLFSCPTNFSRHGSLPRLLGGFFKRVFSKDGSLLDEPCPECIFYIRQICRFFKKLKIRCTPEREAQAEARFIEIEGELFHATENILREDLLLDQISGIVWSQVFPELDGTQLVCHHGPGATAEMLLPNGRKRIRQWYDRSELSFPSDLHCFPNYWEASLSSGNVAGAGGIEYRSVRDELPVRVVFVPKTLTSPRVIAIEPSHVQYMQQGLKDYVYEVLESHPLTKRSIRFSRQDVNQQLAYSSSKDRSLATLDLKDASDRVHFELVRRIFKTSGILDYLEDSRSLHATLPSGRNIVLSKFASMGSALCFPVEAMVFYTLIQCAMHDQDGIRPCSRSIAAYSRKIDVYGDDIIVPVAYADAVVQKLESYSLKVNINKSFRFSHFRESCGADFYKGVAVNPVYAREVPPDAGQKWGPSELMSWNCTADLFYLRGMWHVAQVVRDMVQTAVKRPIPRSRYPGSGIVHISLLFSTGLRLNAQTQSWEQRRTQFTPLKRKDNIDGDANACLQHWGLSQLSVLRGNMDDDASRRNILLRRALSSAIPGAGLLGFPDSNHHDVEPKLCVAPFPLNASEQSGDYAGLENSRGALCLNDAVYWSETSDLPNRGLEFQPDLSYLDKRADGLDFNSSVNRGRFKSKCRWTSLLG